MDYLYETSDDLGAEADNKKEISAFAFNIGKQIEKVIHNRVGEIYDKNKYLEALILKWYLESGKDPKFAEFFSIQTQ